ncbi:MAG TPA: L-2-hydroxyglutarate oxidase [Balneolaceae bacterium]|nr:L-2-hydroxyglutarate oxidase [Balneolaceae bacterium]
MAFDFTIVGAGIVGLSAAYKLSEQYADAQILILEKENRVAAHQTGHNSGVIHSGIYYEPNSYRAKNCVNGRHQLVDFCREHDVAHEICGKVIVATEESQLPTLDQIFENGKENGIEGIRKIDARELQEIEPYANGIKAIHVPCTGIVDYIGVCKKLHELISQKNGGIKFGQEVTEIHTDGEDVVVRSKTDQFTTRYLINCAGLYSDRVAESAGVDTEIQIVPFRGEYYRLKPEAAHMVKGLIYPMPYSDFPFLGVHFTKMALGGVECGPNAVFAFKREGYEKLSFDLKETIETAKFSGFWELAKQHWRMGLAEYYRSFSKRAFVRDLQKLVPAIRSHHLEPSPAGVRAMALRPNGDIVDDFQFAATSSAIHVLNAPSPAATAGLAIGDEIAEKAKETFRL